MQRLALVLLLVWSGLAIAQGRYTDWQHDDGGGDLLFFPLLLILWLSWKWTKAAYAKSKVDGWCLGFVCAGVVVAFLTVPAVQTIGLLLCVPIIVAAIVQMFRGW